MKRLELQQLAHERVLDSQSLLGTGQWSGAYYLVGYAVELGLKACILAHVENTGAIFLDKKFSEKCWTHDLEQLVSLADLVSARGMAISTDPALGVNWSIVKDWDETARYQTWTETKARLLYEAVTNPASGVLTWIKTNW